MILGGNQCLLSNFTNESTQSCIDNATTSLLNKLVQHTSLSLNYKCLMSTEMH